MTSSKPITREVIEQIKDLLGVDPALTRSVSIYPRAVYVETVETKDGAPVITDGEVRYVRAECAIEEPADDDS